nr:PAS domain S-box protein [Candidatus Sigynarchaeota archaeon]
EYQFAQLRQGKYLFRLTAQNALGIWSDPVETETIHILPPIYLRPWFLGILLIIIIGLIVFVVHYFLTQRHSRLLVAWVEERTADLKNSNDRFITIMDSIDTPVYVADMETYDILFVNRRACDIFGHVIGKRCWEVFHADREAPCDFCTNDKLLDSYGEPIGAYVWEMQNSVTKRWYELHDRAIKWIDGRIVRMEIMTDITERKQAADELKYRISLEQLISDISAYFITLPSSKIDAGIHYALKRIGKFAKPDRCVVFLLSSEGEKINNTHEWCAEGIESQKEQKQNIPVEQIRWWMNKLHQSEAIHIPRVAKMTMEAEAERIFLERMGVKSLVVVPLESRDTLIGFLSMES